MMEWDNKMYEEQMFYFNNIIRVSYYEHDVEVEGLDHCYDCASEVYILKKYLLSSKSRWMPWYQQCYGTHNNNKEELSKEELSFIVAEMINSITYACNGSVNDNNPNYRSLINWRRNYSFPKKIFDNENLNVVYINEENEKENKEWL